jgi:hypothetical protein
MSRSPSSVPDIPLRPVYPLCTLARALGMDRRTLKGILERAGVRFFGTHKSLWVPLSELELKVPPLWASIRAAEMLRHLHDDEGE